jgi:benzoyl-CoA reductase/2-hydroxyglutaryl-CoA dehydratase subunit BcrC/BadD/HgdB
MSNKTPNMPSLGSFFLKNPGLYFKGMKNQLKQGVPMDLLSLMGDFIKKTKKADLSPTQLVANFTAGFPVEFLLAFDVWPGFPESSACTAGMCEITQPLIEHAEGMGYSRDLCAYMKTSVGAFDKGYPLDFGGSPVADMYFGTNGVCDTHAKWFENEARKHGRPYFAIDVPCVVSGSDDARRAIDYDYIVAQLHELIKFLEKQTGKKFDQEKFMSIIAKSQECNRLYLEFFKYRQRMPAAEYFVFMRVFMFGVFAQWDQDAAIKYYQGVLKKMEKRYAQAPEKVGQPEKYRLMWEGITLWYGTDFYKEMAKKGAHVVYELYTESSAFRKRKTSTLDETLRQMAVEFTSATYVLDQERRIPFMEQKIKEYSIDGVILHANMSCRPSAAGLQDVKTAIEKDMKIPVLILTCDMIDPRAFSEAQVRTRIDAFIEMMEENQIQQQKQILSGGTGQWQTINR